MPDTIEEANERVAGWVSGFEVGELAQRLDSVGAPYGVVRTMREALDQTYLAERELIKKLPDPIDGELRVVRSSLHFSNADIGPDRPSPLAGEHSRSILSSVGYTAVASMSVAGCPHALTPNVTNKQPPAITVLCLISHMSAPLEAARPGFQLCSESCSPSLRFA